jgi:histidine triad (HIT) family protein
MEDCLFCNVIAKKIPALVVYENADTMAFLELFPSAPGHTMVISKKHGNNILEYSQEELGKLMASVQIVAKKIETALKTDSLTIGINHKEIKGVPHLHIHIIPRWKTDKGGVLQSIVNNPSKESREALAEKIKKIK